MTIHLFIKPLDVWLFRDGRPFNQGFDHQAHTLFPPLPSVLQGVIRTHFIEQHGGIPAYLEGNLAKVNEYIGKHGDPPPPTFRLQGPFLARWFDNGQLIRYFPLPTHAYKQGQVYRLLQPEIRADILTDLDQKARLLWCEAGTTAAKVESEGGVWLDEDTLLKLLRQGQLPTSCATEGSTLFQRESRLGIQRNDATLSTHQGALYQAEFIRPYANVGLYVAVKGLPDDWPQKGILRIGGEGHYGSYQRLDKEPQSLAHLPAGSHGMTVTFLTPTYFSEGWRPAQGDWSAFFEQSVQCVAAAVGRYQAVGGFDLARKRHKPTHRYVPAGSTYYFEGTAKPRFPVICDNPIDTKINQIDKIDHVGFGQFILGGW